MLVHNKSTGFAEGDVHLVSVREWYLPLLLESLPKILEMKKRPLLLCSDPFVHIFAFTIIMKASL